MPAPRIPALLLLALPLAGLAAETHIVYAAADLPSFGLTTSIAFDLAPPFVAPEVRDRGTVGAEVRLPGGGPGAKVRIYAPALFETADQLARSYQLFAPTAKVTSDDRCVRTVSDAPGEPFTLDCVLRTATQAVNCTYTGADAKAIAAAERLCRSITLQ